MERIGIYGTDTGTIKIGSLELLNGVGDGDFSVWELEKNEEISTQVKWIGYIKFKDLENIELAEWDKINLEQEYCLGFDGFGSIVLRKE